MSPAARSTPTRRGPGRPAAGGESTREALLEAGRELFATMGYGTASARDIVERAGCTAPVLYHHFGSKAGLFAAVVDDVNETVLSTFAEAIEGRADVRERIEAILDATVQMQEIAPSLGRFVVMAPVEVQRHAELQVAADEMGRLGRFIHETCAQADGAAVPARDVEHVVLTLIYGLSRMAASSRPGGYVGAVDALKTMLRGELFHRGDD